ncbi:hypothetical protein GCM10008904_21000 [Paraclostridium ghonii]
MKVKVIDLSTKILSLVSIVSIILIVSNIAMDIIFDNSIHYINIIPLIMLYIFSKYFRKKCTKE